MVRVAFGRIDVSVRFGLKAGAAALLLGVSSLTLTHVLHAQEQSVLASADPDARFLLSSDELLYNLDSERVIAQGAVQIDYDGYQMVADRVEYDQRTGRLMAVGGIELVEPGGNRIYADELDLTDDFADGFVNALRIETPDNTRLVAESAERTGGTQTTLNNGTYTACNICEEDPSKAPLWQIKARRVIQNGENQTIRLEQASFELFGRPIAYLPYLVVPDYQNRRVSGFLSPSVSFSSTLDLGVTVPYYFALTPHMDATVAVTGYSAQGFLTEAEFRRRFATGDVTVRAAGIYQLSPEDFDARTVDRLEDARGLFNTTGRFNINESWSYGWDLTVQSDSNFGQTYGIDYFNNERETSEVYLTGLRDRNYFDLRGMYFDVQSPRLTDIEDAQQPFVHPSLDYNYTAGDPVFGGELTADVNLASLTRTRADFKNFPGTGRDRIRGIDGTTSRLTGETEWKRSVVTGSGLVITPILALRGDLHSSELDETSAISAFTPAVNDFDARSMATAGVEARYPVLLTSPGSGSSHIIEPIGQLFVRPNEQMAGRLPNEDAQSFVFDATTLFERDKFSGYDRIEGGTRANLGLRYTGSFANGYSLNAVVGQSYHLGGVNSFASDDFVNAGANSGLETDVSDFVGEVALMTPADLGFRAGSRFSKETMDINRFDAGATYANETVSLEGGVTYQREQPEYNFDVDRYEVRGSGALRFAENWSVFGAASYDAREGVLTTSAIGFGYDDECFTFRIAYIEERDERELSGSDWSVGAQLTFRTLGDISSGGALDRFGAF